jgi:hypothetical protein
LIVWLNGTFGAGKTTTAGRLVPLLHDARLFDPELVGYMLTACLTDRPVDDFQDWPAWRSLVVATTAALASTTGQDIVAAQTVLRERYWSEIRAGLVRSGLEVFHVLLTADGDTLRRRIEGSHEAHEWRLEHLEQYEAARSWMSATADLVVDTTRCDADQAAEIIAASLPAPARRLPPDGRQR